MQFLIGGIYLELFAFFQEVRNVAMNCIEGLHTFSSHVDSLTKKNGICLLRNIFLSVFDFVFILKY